MAMWIWKSPLTFGAEIIFESFFFFGDLNTKPSSSVFCKAIVFTQFYEKPFSLDNVLNFMLNCWDMAPDVPHIYMSHEFMTI